MSKKRQKAHYTDSSLLCPANPVTVNLIGAGGTGSKVLTGLVEMNHSLLELGHPGLLVRLWDDDVVTAANIGRQRFAASETGLHKSVALVNRANRWSGTNWKAETKKFGREQGRSPEHAAATISIGCVDSVAARFEITEILCSLRGRYPAPQYYLDFGNSRHTGQVLLSTIGTIAQPQAGQYEGVGCLPLVTEEFGGLLRSSEQSDDTPGCSLAEALERQDLYINASLAQMGCSLLWNLLRNGLTPYRGFFHNLKDFTTHPLKVR